MADDTKFCKTCGDTKPAESFHGNPNTRDRLNTVCKACDSIRLRARSRAIKASVKVIPASKICPACQEDKPSSEFGKRSDHVDGLAHSCKICTRKKHAVWLALNPDQKEKNRERQRAVYADKERYFGYLYRNKFGITLDQYESMLESQCGGCAICAKQPIEGEPRLSVDHDHSCCKGKKSCGACVRGLLCNDCNFGIGLFKDQKKLLEKAVSYLAAE